MCDFCIPRASPGRAHSEATHNPPPPAHSSCLHSCKHPSPISPLECALTRYRATAHSKELTESPKPFRMRSYAKTGGEGPRRSSPSRLPFTPKETCRTLRPPVFRTFFQVPYPLSLVFSHSSKNCRGVGVQSRSLFKFYFNSHRRRSASEGGPYMRRRDDSGGVYFMGGEMGRQTGR